jgi:sporulation protein YlmC with PRC-barrel domain
MIRTPLIAIALTAALALPAAADKGPDQPLTAQDAKNWVGKPVFSNDGKEVGKVTLLESSPQNKATQLRAEIGGTAGPDRHQIILPATRFALQGDRVVLDMTAAQAEKLPKMNY